MLKLLICFSDSLGGSLKVVVCSRIQVSVLQQNAQFQAATSKEGKEEDPPTPSPPNRENLV